MLVIDINKFDKQQRDLLENKIKNTKDKVERPNNMDLYEGRRYFDDSRIAYMICGNILQEVDLDYKEANSKFISMNNEEISRHIEKAVLESMCADYYYAYEKEY